MAKNPYMKWGNRKRRKNRGGEISCNRAKLTQFQRNYYNIQLKITKMKSYYKQFEKWKIRFKNTKKIEGNEI